ncbi:MAG: ParB N-terminal domain-containing protein [Candidatus Zambryskibacteria bacterium]|nr:ParB N-terminal domain-containing protein [Candidatus Zambryskibacteria bacterium]
MRTLGTEKVKLADLNTNLFVREELDQDHVLYLAELIQNGVALPPIEITKDYDVVEGRHRIEAFELNSIKNVEAKILSFSSDSEMIGYAYKSNAGGHKPPTTADTEHTVALLIKNGETIKCIAEILGLPPSLTRKYVRTIKSKISRQKINSAVSAVTEGGLTAPKAAEKYGIEVEKLKETLSGKRKKQRTNGIAEIFTSLTTNYKSASQKNAAIFKKLRDQYDDGDVSKKQILEVIKRIKDLQKKHVRSLDHWEKRFLAKFESD